MYLSLDHAPLIVCIPIAEENIHSSRLSIPKNSEEEAVFVKEATTIIKNLDTSNLTDSDRLKDVVNLFASKIKQVWVKNAKQTNIMKHSKKWWSEKCNQSLDKYRTSRNLEDWKSFKKVVKNTKRVFFDIKIQEIANKSQGSWELINWVNKRKLPVIKAIKYDNQPYLTLNSLWNTLHSSFNMALHQQINIEILDKIIDKSLSSWVLFSREEFKNVISNCNNLSTSGPDKLLWSHLKSILKHNECLINIVNIVNTCINLGHWPAHFKRSSTRVIPKLNKQLYDSPKSFRPIILLNMLGKLIEKVIVERLQFQVMANDVIHPSQLGGLKFKSTIDAGIALTHIIYLGWVKNISTSTLAFDIAQFFLFLNHCLLTYILQKVGLDIHVVNFFTNYLINRKTNYLWNNFSSPIFDVNVGVGQGSALSPILSALYLSPFLYILENYLKNLNILVSIISFVDDGLFIFQNKLLDISNSHLFCSYNIMTKLLDKFGLIVEHSKTEVFHFNRLHGPFNSPSLNLSSIGGSVLTPKNLWKYLGFIFDRKLSFYQHIDFYSNKAMSTVKCMKIFGNSSHSISPIQKHLLYRCCVLPIALYGFQLWFYNYAPLSYPLKILCKMQRRAAI